MGYIEDLSAVYRGNEKLVDYQLDACTYPAFYRYWTNELFERLMRVFVWENTYELEGSKIIGIDPKQIESRLILKGYCAITKLPNEKELTAFFASMFGPTKYYDEWKQVNVHCPIYAGTRTIDKDAIIINNTPIRTPTYMHVHHYSTMLAHAEVTLIDMLVDARDNGGVPVAQTQKQFESIRGYQKKRFIGKYDVVTDMGGLGVDYAGSDRKTSQPVLDVLEVRNKLVRSFYSDIGVRSAFEKKSNVNSLEIDGNDSVLEFNISTMLKQRELACEKVNELYGTNWSVHVAEEIDYEKIEEEEEQKMLNQQEQFSQMNKNEGDNANEDSEDK